MYSIQHMQPLGGNNMPTEFSQHSPFYWTQSYTRGAADAGPSTPSGSSANDYSNENPWFVQHPSAYSMPPEQQFQPNGAFNFQQTQQQQQSHSQQQSQQPFGYFRFGGGYGEPQSPVTSMAGHFFPSGPSSSSSSSMVVMGHNSGPSSPVPPPFATAQRRIKRTANDPDLDLDNMHRDKRFVSERMADDLRFGLRISETTEGDGADAPATTQVLTPLSPNSARSPPLRSANSYLSDKLRMTPKRTSGLRRPAPFDLGLNAAGDDEAEGSADAERRAHHAAKRMSFYYGDDNVHNSEVVPFDGFNVEPRFRARVLVNEPKFRPPTPRFRSSAEGVNAGALVVYKKQPKNWDEIARSLLQNDVPQSSMSLPRPPRPMPLSTTRITVLDDDDSSKSPSPTAADAMSMEMLSRDDSSAIMTGAVPTENIEPLNTAHTMSSFTPIQHDDASSGNAAHSMSWAA